MRVVAAAGGRCAGWSQKLRNATIPSSTMLLNAGAPRWVSCLDTGRACSCSFCFHAVGSRQLRWAPSSARGLDAVAPRRVPRLGTGRACCCSCCFHVVGSRPWSWAPSSARDLDAVAPVQVFRRNTIPAEPSPLKSEDLTRVPFFSGNARMLQLGRCSPPGVGTGIVRIAACQRERRGGAAPRRRSA